MAAKPNTWQVRGEYLCQCFVEMLGINLTPQQFGLALDAAIARDREQIASGPASGARTGAGQAAGTRTGNRTRSKSMASTSN